MDRLGTKQLTTMMGAWASGGGPLYRQLADAIAGLIDRGEVSGEVSLPPERPLAEELAVSRTTVASAYQRLKGAGLVVGHQGRGTIIVGKRAGQMFNDFTGEIYSAVLGDASEVIDLTSACQTASQQLRTIIAGSSDLEMAITGHGYEPRGIESLRLAIARYLTDRGLRTEADQLVITTGAQQAIALSCVLGSPRDVVLCEEFTFPGALDAFRRHGLRPIGVPADGGGIRLDDFEAAVAKYKPTLAYVTPSFSNPTGIELDRSRRSELMRLAAAGGAAVVEDNTLELLTHGPSALPPLAARGGPDVVTVGSLSKAAWGGLRVGWVRANSVISERLVRAKTVTDIGSPILNQQLAVPVVDALPELAAEIVKRVRVAHRAALTAFSELLPAWSCPMPRGGLCSWVHAPGVDVDVLAQLAQRHGVVITPGSIFSPDTSRTDHFRLPLIYSPSVMTEAVKRIAQAAAAQAA